MSCVELSKGIFPEVFGIEKINGGSVIETSVFLELKSG